MPSTDKTEAIAASKLVLLAAVEQLLVASSSSCGFFQTNKEPYLLALVPPITEADWLWNRLRPARWMREMQEEEPANLELVLDVLRKVCGGWSL